MEMAAADVAWIGASVAVGNLAALIPTTEWVAEGCVSRAVGTRPECSGGIVCGYGGSPMSMQGAVGVVSLAVSTVSDAWIGNSFSQVSV